MAITVDAVSAALTQNQVSVATQGSASITINAAATGVVVLLEASLSGSQSDALINFTTLSVGGQALTHLGSAISHSGGSTSGFVDVYYLLAPPTGTVNLLINQNGGVGTSQCIDAFAISLLGAIGSVAVVTPTNGQNVSAQTITATLATGDLMLGICCNGASAPTATTGTQVANATGDTSTASHGGIRILSNTGTTSTNIVFATNSADFSAATGIQIVAAGGATNVVPLGVYTPGTVAHKNQPGRR